EGGARLCVETWDPEVDDQAQSILCGNPCNASECSANFSRRLGTDTCWQSAGRPGRADAHDARAVAVMFQTPGRADAHDAWAVARDAPDTADAHDALAVLGHRRTETVVFCALLLMKPGQDNLAVCLDDRAVAVMPRTPRRHQASTIDAHDKDDGSCVLLLMKQGQDERMLMMLGLWP
ncbi:unnamed protein product, partial [Symbiodinium microadriaticum]